MGAVGEAAFVGDGGDGPCAIARIGEHPVGARNALPEHEFRERGARGLEQPVHVSRCHAMARCNRGHVERGAREIRHDVIVPLPGAVHQQAP
jgi:hypothetical protein